MKKFSLKQAEGFDSRINQIDNQHIANRFTSTHSVLKGKGIETTKIDDKALSHATHQPELTKKFRHQNHHSFGI